MELRSEDAPRGPPVRIPALDCLQDPEFMKEISIEEELPDFDVDEGALSVCVGDNRRNGWSQR